MRGGAPIGEITSAGWSPLAGACDALGYLRGAAALEAHAGAPAQVDLWGEAISVRLFDRWPVVATAA